MDTPLRVITFNLKRDLPFFRSHRWAQRREIAAELCRRSKADLIGVQELMPDMRRDLEELLAGEYAIAGFGRYYGTRHTNEDEHSDILVRAGTGRTAILQDLLALQPGPNSTAAGDCWLPIPGSALWRRSVCGIRDAASGYSIPTSTTSPARPGIWQPGSFYSTCRSWISGSPCPNCSWGTSTPPMTAAVSAFSEKTCTSIRSGSRTPMKNTTACAPIPITALPGRVKAGRSPIDYIFASEEFEILSSRISTFSLDGEYPSDHFPLIADLVLKGDAE